MRKTEMVKVLLLVLVVLGALALISSASAPPSVAEVAHDTFPPSTVVVARRNFLNQTASLPPTVLFTPSNAGDFRLNVYIAVSNCVGNAGNGDVGFADTWNDGVANDVAGTVEVSCPSNGATAYTQGSQIIHSAAGQAISFYAVENADSTYNLYLTLEKL